MLSEHVELVIAICPIWGALLSRVLAFRDYLKSRLRLHVDLRWSEESGTESKMIVLSNYSTLPAMVNSCHLGFGKVSLFGSANIERYVFADYVQTGRFTINPYDNHILEYSGPDHFTIRQDETRSLTLIVDLFGRKRPLVHEIWKP